MTAIVDEQPRRQLLLGASLSWLALLFICLVTPLRLVDDAYISFRYADNLAHHGELVFNLGERVEGITNLLWTLILASQVKFLGYPLEVSALALSLALLFVVTLRLWQIARLAGGRNSHAALAVACLALSPSYISTMTNGLESALHGALLAETVYRYWRGQHLAAFAVAGLLFLNRPEAAVVGLLLLGIVAWESRTMKTARNGLILFTVVVVGVTLFRLLYFGSPLPNSVIAKSGDLLLLGPLVHKTARGVLYLIRFGLTNAHLVLAVGAAAAWLWNARRNAPPDRLRYVGVLCLAVILSSWAIAVYNGGDWMGGYRLLMQYGVLYAVLLLLTLRNRMLPMRLAAVMIVLPVAQTAIQLIQAREASLSLQYGDSQFWVETTDRLSGVLDSDDVVSAEAIGYIGYHLDVRFHDPVGLMDRYLARHGEPSPTFGKNDATYTAATVRPSVMVWHYAGHLHGVDQHVLDEYVTFCAGDCDDRWTADIVMIRSDRVTELGPAFSDWQRVRLGADRIEGARGKG